MRLAWVPLLIVVTACGACAPTAGSSGLAGSATPSSGADPSAIEGRLTCGGATFTADRLDQGGNAAEGDNPAAAALRRHLTDPAIAMETESLPREGWKLVAADGGSAQFLALTDEGDAPSYAYVLVEADLAGWRVSGWGGCRLEPAVASGLGLAEFRVAPGQALAAETTEIGVLVTERACNSGEDARGRIVEPEIVESADSVTVVFAVRPRGGAQECPSNPETPFLLVLPTPLGDRALLDGSSIPARDATTCPDSGAMVDCP